MAARNLDSSNMESTQKKVKFSLLYTGGTIAAETDATLGLESGSLDGLLCALRRYYPSLFAEFNIDTKAVLNLMSENLNPTDWTIIGKEILKAIRSGSRGIVVVHGTDSLVYTATAISFAIQPNVPILFTGANLPYVVAGSTALENLKNSFLAARAPLKPGTYTIFPRSVEETVILQSNRTREIQAYEQRFDELPGALAGLVKDNEVILESEFVRRKKPFVGYTLRDDKDMTVGLQFDHNVARFKVFPGFNPQLITAAAEMGARGILLELFHSGTGCTRDTDSFEGSILDPIGRIKETCPVFILPPPKTITDKGLHSNPITYKTAIKLQQVGAISLPSMTVEAATVKLMWALGQSGKQSQVIRLMQRDQAGETLPIKR